MKSLTYLGRGMLLVALLAVSWVAAAPFQTETEKEDVRDELYAFLEQNPSIAEDLYPELLELATEVNMTVNQEDVLDLLDGYVRESTVEEIEEELEREEEEEELARMMEEEQTQPRKKRQTVTGNYHSSSNAFGKTTGGSLGLSHSWNNGRHSVSGSLGAAKHTPTGMGSSSSYSAGIGYKYRPNKKTSFGFSAHKSMMPGGGSSHGFGVSFSHKFGR